MAQSAFQMLKAYLLLALDILLQHFINWRAANGVPYFDKGGTDLLAGKTVVITGANTGLGFEAARWLLANGAAVVLACRSVHKGNAAAVQLRIERLNAAVYVEKLDLSDLDSVRECAERLRNAPIDVLVLNAGVMRANPIPRRVEPHMAVNHGAHALLMLLLAPILRERAGRVVSVSSYAAIVSDLSPGSPPPDSQWFTQYANSKLAQLLFTRAVYKRAPKLPMYCVHPGESTTSVARNMGRVWMWLHQNLGRMTLISPRIGARTTVYAAAAPLDDPALLSARGGVLLHAVKHRIEMPSHLVNDDDSEWMWYATLKMIAMSEHEALRLLGEE